MIPPEWGKIYAVPGKQLHLDIGCGRGRLLLDLAQVIPEFNFLGLEIREPLVREANQRRDTLGIANLHYFFCNVNNSLTVLLNSLPVGVLTYVTILFPDPWFKTRHAKRRVVQPKLVDTLARYLVEGGIIFLQSDVEMLIQEMCDHFEKHSCFRRYPTSAWLVNNPLPIGSEREMATLSRGEPVYRVLFSKETAISRKF